MKKTKNQSKETLSRGYLSEDWNEWTINYYSEDPGLDGDVIVCKDEEICYDLAFAFQLKSTENLKKNDSGEVLFSYDSEHLKSFMKHPRPVLLVIYDLSSKQGYWINVQRYIEENNLDPESQKYFTLKIPSSNKVREKEKIIKELENSVPTFWKEKTIESIRLSTDRELSAISKETFEALLKIIKDNSSRYSLRIEEDLDIRRDNLYGKVMFYLTKKYVSPLELRQDLWEDKDSPWICLILGDGVNNKVYLPLGDEKIGMALSDLLKHKYISLKESEPLVWLMDGGLFPQPADAKVNGQSISEETIAFIFEFTKKGEDKIKELYGTDKEIWNLWMKSPFFK